MNHNDLGIRWQKFYGWTPNCFTLRIIELTFCYCNKNYSIFTLKKVRVKIDMEEKKFILIRKRQMYTLNETIKQNWIEHSIRFSFHYSKYFFNIYRCTVRSLAS